MCNKTDCSHSSNNSETVKETIDLSSIDLNQTVKIADKTSKQVVITGHGEGCQCKTCNPLNTSVSQKDESKLKVIAKEVITSEPNLPSDKFQQAKLAANQVTKQNQQDVQIFTLQDTQQQAVSPISIQNTTQQLEQQIPIQPIQIEQKIFLVETPQIVIKTVPQVSETPVISQPQEVGTFNETKPPAYTAHQPVLTESVKVFTTETPTPQQERGAVAPVIVSENNSLTSQPIPVVAVVEKAQMATQVLSEYTTATNQVIKRTTTQATDQQTPTQTERSPVYVEKSAIETKPLTTPNIETKYSEIKTVDRVNELQVTQQPREVITTSEAKTPTNPAYQPVPSESIKEFRAEIPTIQQNRGAITTVVDPESKLSTTQTLPGTLTAEKAINISERTLTTASASDSLQQAVPAKIFDPIQTISSQNTQFAVKDFLAHDTLKQPLSRADTQVIQAALREQKIEIPLYQSENRLQRELAADELRALSTAIKEQQSLKASDTVRYENIQVMPQVTTLRVERLEPNTVSLRSDQLSIKINKYVEQMKEARTVQIESITKLLATVENLHTSKEMRLVLEPVKNLKAEINKIELATELKPISRSILQNSNDKQFKETTREILDRIASARQEQNVPLAKETVKLLREYVVVETLRQKVEQVIKNLERLPDKNHALDRQLREQLKSIEIDQKKITQILAKEKQELSPAQIINKPESLSHLKKSTNLIKELVGVNEIKLLPQIKEAIREVVVQAKQVVGEISLSKEINTNRIMEIFSEKFTDLKTLLQPLSETVKGREQVKIIIKDLESMQTELIKDVLKLSNKELSKRDVSVLQQQNQDIKTLVTIKIQAADLISLLQRVGKNPQNDQKLTRAVTREQIVKEFRELIKTLAERPVYNLQDLQRIQRLQQLLNEISAHVTTNAKIVAETIELLNEELNESLGLMNSISRRKLVERNRARKKLEGDGDSLSDIFNDKNVAENEEEFKPQPIESTEIVNERTGNTIGTAKDGVSKSLDIEQSKENDGSGEEDFFKPYIEERV